MITSIFSKSKPVNFLIVAIAMVLVFVMTNLSFEEFTFYSISHYILRLIIALFFVFLLDFVIAKNDLTKKNSYGIMVLLLIFAIFPEVLTNTDMMLSGIFVCFALRRILSLHTNRHVKKKFFDATFWIALAALCYSWALLFLIVVFLAYVFHWQNDMKTIVVSFLGLFTVFALMLMYNIVFYDIYFKSSAISFHIDFNFSYFNSISKISALTVISTIYIWSLFHYFRQVGETKKKEKSRFVLVAVASLVAFCLVIITPKKNGTELIFMFMPFAIIVANYLERIPVRWFREVVVSLLIIASLLRLLL